jgi:hypothetical protein
MKNTINIGSENILEPVRFIRFVLAAFSVVLLINSVGGFKV